MSFAQRVLHSRALLPPCLLIGAALSVLHGQRAAGWPGLIAVIIGASGTMAVSQAGLASNEVLLACLVLAGLRRLMALYGTTPHAWRAAVLAGLCCGLAAGLKPTAVVYSRPR